MRSKRQLSVQPFRQWPICGLRDLKARSGIQVRTANALMQSSWGDLDCGRKMGRSPPPETCWWRALLHWKTRYTILQKDRHTFILQISFWLQRFIQSSLFSLTSKTLWFWFNCVLPEMACTRIFRCVKTVTTIQRVFLPLVQLP